MATLTAPLPAITDEQRRLYHERGWFVLERAILHDDLALVRRECDRRMEEEYARWEREEKQAEGISQHNGRYFISFPSKDGRMERFLYGELMAAICRATIGDDAWLFYDQFVIKGAETGTSFAWHQDSGYVGAPHRPYLTCWCALDDVSEANGTIYVRSYQEAGSREIFPHTWDDQEQSLVGYRGSDPGTPIIIPAGSIAVFSSLVLHRSSTNTTERRRRAYVVQYSTEELRKPDGEARGLVEPFLRGGVNVRRERSGG